MIGKKKLRVVQIFKYYYPHVGGVEKVARQIAEGLKDEIATRMLVCHDRRKSEYDTVNGIDVLRAGTVGTYFSVPLAARFPFFMRSMARQADILHFHLPYPLADMSYLLARPQGKVVVWWHSEIVRPKQLSKLYKPFLARFLRKADRIIAAAPQLLSGPSLVARFRHKCEVVPIGIDTARFQPTRGVEEKAQEIRRRYGSKIILFIGRLIYYKGVDYLINAVADLGNAEARLLLIGDGPLKPDLAALAAARGVADRVVFLGEVSDEEIVAYYHACHLFVLPSVANTEAFGIVQLEAMACGKPVVSTDLPTGVPFVNLHGKTGFIVPPRNASALASSVRLLLENKALAGQYGEAGRQRVLREFTVEGMLRGVLSVYRHTMNGN